MVTGYRQADFLAHFETTVWGEDDDVRRLHGVLRGKNDPAMVNSALELGITWTTHSEMPLEKVVCNHKKLFRQQFQRQILILSETEAGIKNIIIIIFITAALLS